MKRYTIYEENYEKYGTKGGVVLGSFSTLLECNRFIKLQLKKGNNAKEYWYSIYNQDYELLDCVNIDNIN